MDSITTYIVALAKSNVFSIFWTALSLTTIITSLLAFGILHMRGVLGWAGWRYVLSPYRIASQCNVDAAFLQMAVSH